MCFDKTINNYIINNYINLFYLNELSFINFFNFKNIFINYNFYYFNFIFNNLNKNFTFIYNTEFNNISQIYYSIILDYKYIFTNIYFLCFNFNNTYNLNNTFISNYLNFFFVNNYSYKLIFINLFKKQIINYNSWLLLLILVILLYFFFIWIYFIFFNKINLLYKNEKFYDNYNVTTNYLIESEKELGSLDDMFVGISILICIYGWFFFGTLFFNLFSNISIIYLYVGFPIFLLIVLGMPTNMLLNYGILYPIYLRGSSNTTILLLEFMYDILATGVMYMRLVVQNVRFIIIFFAFFECYEFFYNNFFIFKNFYYYSNNNINNISIFYWFFMLIFNFIVFYVYNIGHLMYTILSHFFAYLVLVFWFFSFLYTTFFEEKLELFFKKKNKE